MTELMKAKRPVGLDELDLDFGGARANGCEPFLILESFDRRTLAKMEIALEHACGLVSTGRQKHRSRRYIARHIIERASNGDRSLDSLTSAAIAAAKELNANRQPRMRDGARAASLGLLTSRMV
jgi:hypothetical protein